MKAGCTLSLRLSPSRDGAHARLPSRSPLLARPPAINVMSRAARGGCVEPAAGFFRGPPWPGRARCFFGEALSLRANASAGVGWAGGRGGGEEGGELGWPAVGARHKARSRQALAGFLDPLQAL